MKILVIVFVALIAVVVYQFGLLEKPPFEYQDSLVESELIAVVAVSREKNIGAHVSPLIEGSLRAIQNTLGKAELAAAAKLYGSPEGAEYVSIGLYLDDPWTVERPRWAIGYGVQGPSKSELDAMVDQFQKASELSPEENPFRVVRIGTGPVVKAKIPWRNRFTPMIAPALHWSRGTKTFDKGNYQKDKEDERSVACLEIYVTGPGGSLGWLDYVVSWDDDARMLWDDAFPLEPEEQEVKSETQQVDEPEEPEVKIESDQVNEPEEPEVKIEADQVDEPEEQDVKIAADQVDEPEEQDVENEADQVDEPEEQDGKIEKEQVDEPDEQEVKSEKEPVEEPVVKQETEQGQEKQADMQEDGPDVATE